MEAVAKKPFYKKWWVWIIPIIIIGGILIFENKNKKKEAYEYAVSQAQQTDFDGYVGEPKPYSEDRVREYKRNGQTYYDIIVIIGKKRFEIRGITYENDSWSYWGMIY